MASTSLERPQPDRTIDDAALVAAFADPAHAVVACKDALKSAEQSIARRFRDNEPIETLVHERAAAVDHVIVRSWQSFTAGIHEQMDLVAVGGYGRGELHPGSDIDLLILVASPKNAAVEAAVTRFLTFLWDIGLEVGHSVRTLEDCGTQAASDVTVLTSLIESRLLAGAGQLFAELPACISAEKMWNSAEFFEAKVKEQIERHHRYHDTAHNLEPNVKSSPGGLRDIQIIQWIARRHLSTRSLADLVDKGMLTPGQLRILLSGRAFLWRVRFGLHLLTSRREDRLLFDHQIKLAEMLGYEDASYTLAVEQLMQRYYRTVMEISRLNEMLLQLFEENIYGLDRSPATLLSPNFQMRNGYIEAVNESVFSREPAALLEIFLLLEQDTSLRGVNARTIALIKQHLWLIDEEFRQNPRHHRLFLEILRAPKGLSRTLRRMNTYGVLGLYIPAFNRVVGRMQYDLFHAYTVDAHTLFVVENLRRMSMPEFDEEFSHGSKVMQQLDKPEIVYLAGLFHDIAKGRGGDHSTLGAVDAESFCLEHGMSRYDARLVSWLVEQHLSLSLTAQKKDLNDPNVIMEFARLVGDRIHLDYLYALTVADVRGTNPQLWNSWKDSLFWDLYQSTVRALRRGVSNPVDAEELVIDRQEAAKEILAKAGVMEEQWRHVWDSFTYEYFLRHKAPEIAWHTQVLAKSQPTNSILVAASGELSAVNTVVMVYAPIEVFSFARSTAALDELGLDVVDARILPLTNGHTLDTYLVLDADGHPVRDRMRLDDIEQRLFKALYTNDTRNMTVSRRAPRQVRMFFTPVEINFSLDPGNERTIMELIAGDRPGLLLQIGAVLEAQNVTLQNAKIATIGERAEDVFFISTQDSRPLDDAQCETLRNALSATLSQSNRH